MEPTKLGKLYMIPVPLGENDPAEVLAPTVRATIARIDDYIVENEKTARRFIKSIYPEKVQSSLRLSSLNKHTQPEELQAMLAPCLQGKDTGIMSESGCPGVADPGAILVKMAHEKGIQVVPLVGPSSILLALMASGMNGQSFAFNGYLPIDKAEKKSALKFYERLAAEKNQSQIFIETPYRNHKLLDDLTQTLQPNTLLCIAADITLASEFIKTQRVADWKKSKIDIDKRPAIFIIHKDETFGRSREGWQQKSFFGQASEPKKYCREQPDPQGHAIKKPAQRQALFLYFGIAVGNNTGSFISGKIAHITFDRRTVLVMALFLAITIQETFHGTRSAQMSCG